MVCCNEDGYVIGDAILFGLEDDKVNISGRPSVPNWVAFHAETGATMLAFLATTAVWRMKATARRTASRSRGRMPWKF
jgi:hypothetical protein